jgi:protein-tyrosine phosphatase
MRPDRQAVLPPPPPRYPLGTYKICIVCLGNICRSPMAEVVVRSKLAAAGLSGQVSVESAGTGDWYLGGPMAEYSRAELARRGLDGSRHIARQITTAWLHRFDLLLAMDHSNLRMLLRMAARREGMLERIRLFRSFDPAAPEGAEVPDPYGGPAAEYTEAFEAIEPAAQGLVDALAGLLAHRSAR